ncbi:MAG: alpha/beta hydrolase [Gammaproteobacteria bacterium]|nr:alpha/beta hydrolase [Gammaproteobacteria bacterium]
MTSLDRPADAAADRMDPEMRDVLGRMLERMKARPQLGASPPAEMRARFCDDSRLWNRDPPTLARIQDLLVPVGRSVPARLYDPIGDGRALPTLVYFHGGGWVVGDLDSNDRALRLLAQSSGVAVLSVDYCLAPEHPFPAPWHECLAVVRWVRAHGAELGLDVGRLGAGGDSAGANLALATAIALRDAGEYWLNFMLLVYGVYVRDPTSASHRQFGGGDFGLSTAAMEALWSIYLAGRQCADDPHAAPLLAPLDNLPTACIVAGGLDPLRDDSRRLATRLVEVGGSFEYLEYPGVVHGFMSMTRDLAVARRAIAQVAGTLGRALGVPVTGVSGIR